MNEENQQRKSGRRRQPNKTRAKLENGRNSDPMTPSQNGVKLTAQMRLKPNFSIEMKNRVLGN
jgi:hypothetical protein